MKPIFVDASALIAIGNKRDTFHSKALELRYSLKNSGRKFATTSAVLLEFGNAFSQKKLKPTGIKMTPCTSIIVAHCMGISEIFTTDHHFEQAGFSILLKESY